MVQLTYLWEDQDQSSHPSLENTIIGPPECPKCWWGQSYVVGIKTPLIEIGLTNQAKNWWGPVFTSPYIPTALINVNERGIEHAIMYQSH